MARCPVLMIGKLTFCLDFPREFEITSDQQTKLATFPNKSFSCTQWCKLREVIFLLLLFHIFTLSWDAQNCVLFEMLTEFFLSGNEMNFVSSLL